LFDGADVIASGSLEGTAATNAQLTGGVGAPTFGGVPDGLAVNLPAGGAGNDPAASYAFEIFKAGTGIANLIQLEISALEAEGQGKIIASPRLITSNQQQARIEQGQERIFTTSVLGVGSVVTKKAVLSLTVTPQITPDDRVVMDVFVTQDAFVSATDPTINTKQITTQVLLENGETAVIGGIYQQDESTNVSKVPLLGDIPGLGVLFRTKSRQDNRTELLIFLTPRIVNPALNIG
jgi:type IV pilus assembly protein PilQ